MTEAMGGGVLRSVHVGRPQQVTWAGFGSTAIDKSSVVGPVRVETLGLEGDQVADTRHHGGLDQAVYAFAREELDYWADRLGEEIPDGRFAENLTTSGIDVDEAEVGERWSIGTAEFEVASTRTPCNVFKNWMGRSGYDATAWVKRFAEHGRSGPYLRVIAPGSIQAGQPIEVVHRPGHGVTVSTMFRALNTDRELLPELLKVENLAERARQRVESYLGERDT